MSDSDEQKKEIEQYLESSNGFRVYDPDFYGLNYLLDQVLCDLCPELKACYKTAYREDILFEVFDKIVKAEEKRDNNRLNN